MSEEQVQEQQTPPDGGEQPQATPPDETTALLSELGVELKDGMIDPKDHVAMYKAMRELREQAKTHEEATRKATEKARLEAMSEQERAIEEARQEGYQKALEEQRGVVLRTQVTAAALASNFADPEDALRYLDVASLTDEAAVKKAVDKLATDKPYLLKQGPATPSLEQGPRGSKPPGGGDWLGDAIRKKRAG